MGRATGARVCLEAFNLVWGAQALVVARLLPLLWLLWPR